MNAKTFLEQAGRLDLKINTKLEQVERLRSIAYKVTTTLREVGGKTVSTPKSALEDAVVKLVVAEQTLNAQIDRFVDMKNEISEMLTEIVNDDERLLLELRYLCLNSWDDIASKMNTSTSNLYRLHRLAVDSFDRVLAKKGRNNEVSFCK
jgi:DNA-directed RNA polymerase specialized sigma subunit